METKLLKNLIKSKNAIRKKYDAIKSGRIEKEIMLEETFLPISKPLREFKENTETDIDKKIKTEVKKEIKEFSRIDQFPTFESNSISTEQPVKFFKSSPNFTETSYNKTPSKTYSSEQSSSFHSTPIFNLKKPLNNNVSQNSPFSQESFNKNRALASFYTREYTNNSRNIDKAFGPKYNENLNAFELGHHKIEFKEDTITVGENEYPATQGLYELVFMKNPEEYTLSDLENYKNILNTTNVFRTVATDKNSRVKGNGGEKYKKIISNLIRKKGKGLMLVNTQKPNYIYWDDPNEIVERLRLLIASQQAGHSNHNNEIVSIIEELREANIIV